MNLPRTTGLGRPLASPSGHHRFSAEAAEMNRSTKTRPERRHRGGRWLRPRAVSLLIGPMLAKRFG